MCTWVVDEDEDDGQDDDVHREGDGAEAISASSLLHWQLFHTGDLDLIRIRIVHLSIFYI
jgi:hypothetical protein